MVSQALYEKYSPLIGSATAQQIINKNNEARRSFLALKKRLRSRNLPALAVERVDEKSKGSCQLERNQNQYQTACMSQVAVGAEIAYQNRVCEQR